MTKEELKKKVEFVINDHVNKTVSVFVTTDTKGRPQLFNIVDKDLNDLIQMFVQSIKSVLIDKEYIIENYSTSLKREDVLYVYDIDDEHTPEMERMEEVVGIQVPEYFDQGVTRIEKINGLYIVIKDENNQGIITLFKNITNIDKAYAASTFLIFGKENQQFERQRKNMLRISPSFHMMRVNKDIILIDLDKLEKPLHLDAILRREMERDVKILSNELIGDYKKLISVCQQPKYCKKLRHALKKSTVVKKIEDGSLDVKKIIDFVKKNTSLKFHYKDDKFDLKSDAEAIRFIKLMDDDYLLSELTGVKYDSDIKDPMQA